MGNYIDSIYTALNNLTKIVADYIQAEDIIVATLTVTDRIYFPTVFTWNNLINQLPTLLGTNQLVKTNFTGNITQSSGTNHLLDTEIGSITQDGSSVIVQSGDQWNYLKQTQVTDLEVLSSITLPPDITIAGASYTDDLVLNNSTIQQTTNAGQINTLCATDFYSGDVRLSNNLTMIGGAGTIATLKNLIVVGTSQLGIITGTTITDLYNSIALKANINSPTFTGTVSGITKAMVGLSNVDNTTDIGKPVSTAQQTALNLKANSASPTFTGTVNGITKTMVGLSNVDNTTDLLKPISTATQTALDLKLTAAGGTLSSGIADRLYIRNLGGGSISFPSNTFGCITTNRTGGGGEIDFISSSTGYPTAKSCMWETYNGSTYDTLMYLTKQGVLTVTGNIVSPTITTINSNIALKADLASPTFTGTVSGITKSMVGLSNVDNTTDLLKPISTATQNALNLKANAASPSFTGTLTCGGIAASSSNMDISASSYITMMGGLVLVENYGEILARSFIDNTAANKIESTGITCNNLTVTSSMSIPPSVALMAKASCTLTYNGTSYVMSNRQNFRTWPQYSGSVYADKISTGVVSVLIDNATGLNNANFMVSATGSYNDGVTGSSGLIIQIAQKSAFSDGTSTVGYSFKVVITRTNAPSTVVDLATLGRVDLLVFW
jgi:hypothetical protein